MRLWTIHPKHLDARGLVALWREGLLAQKVLQGKTRGYRSHPQLLRFKEQSNPKAAIAAYLLVIWREARRRGYNFDRSKIAARRFCGTMFESAGQLSYEWQHLKAKLKKRDPGCHSACVKIEMPRAHPVFRIVKGEVREWERRAKISSATSTR